MVFSPGPLPLPLPPRRWRALGQRLTAARATRDWTVLRLAAHLHVQSLTVQRWERGWSRPHRHMLRRLAMLLDIPYEELAALAGYAVDEDGGPSAGAT